MVKSTVCCTIDSEIARRFAKLAEISPAGKVSPIIERLMASYIFDWDAKHAALTPELDKKICVNCTVGMTATAWKKCSNKCPECGAKQ